MTYSHAVFAGAEESISGVHDQNSFGVGDSHIRDAWSEFFGGGGFPCKSRRDVRGEFSKTLLKGIGS